MSKKIVVDSCEHCPFENDYFCNHPVIDGTEITDMSTIHPDCPLEENKRSCTCHD